MQTQYTEVSLTNTTLIGKVAARYLRSLLSTPHAEDATARFLLDRLSAEQMAAIAQAILDDAVLSNLIEMHLPLNYLHGLGLPAEVLTTERATHFRNLPCQRAAMLLANTGDGQAQSLQELMPIGVDQLWEAPHHWIDVITEGQQISDQDKKWWVAALAGLHRVQKFSLERIADYVLQTQTFLKEGVVPALGLALPALEIPRQRGCFLRINEQQRTQSAKWRAYYTSVVEKNAPFLLKHTPSGAPIAQEELRKNFEESARDLQPYQAIIEQFIVSPMGWNDTAAALAQCEWEDIKPLFEQLERTTKEKTPLGEATLNHYHNEYDVDVLDEDERTYLRVLARRKTSPNDATDDDRQFYETHRIELKGNRQLNFQWDRFVFGASRETDDFLLGLLESLNALRTQQEAGMTGTLEIMCDRRTERDLREMDPDAWHFFAFRYSSLQALLDGYVDWQVGPLFRYALSAPSSGSRKASSRRKAMQLNFKIILRVNLPGGGHDRYTTQLTWKYHPDSITGAWLDDWERLKDRNLFAECSTARHTVAPQGQGATIDLQKVQTLEPTFGRTCGTVVGARVSPLEKLWFRNLDKAYQDHFITLDVREKARELFLLFTSEYKSAIEDFEEQGLANPAVLQQKEAYCSLLQYLHVSAKGGSSRDLLVSPLLQIGVAKVVGGPPAAVVTPWHPLRLAAMAHKARQTSQQIIKLLREPDAEFCDQRLFFRDIRQELQHPYYPEIVIGWEGDRAILLSVTDVVGDYSLHEPPTRNAKTQQNDTNEDPQEAANQVIELLRQYVRLYPHEYANLSVVLFNCDSARLPQMLVRKIGQMDDEEDDDEIRCQVILRHRNDKLLSELYERILETSEEDPDGNYTSETSQDFMARLRIAIMAQQDPPAGAYQPHRASMVFSQDVIARLAVEVWHEVHVSEVDEAMLVPARWSRRRPTPRDETSSSVYLCSPAQSAAGWRYLRAIARYFRNNIAPDDQLLPARELSFSETDMGEIIDDTHALGNWVVNFDELLDRRPLLRRDVQVIQYKQSANRGRNLVISSKMPMGVLEVMVNNRLKALSLPLTEPELQDLTQKFLKDARDISGGLILRAAKNGRNASELLGVVLSRFLIQQKAGMDTHFGWYFLDDYADWLGKGEEQIADLLVLKLSEGTNQEKHLTLTVTEAKYIDAGNLPGQRHKSQRQLRDTLIRIQEALFSPIPRIDRDQWLARLSDLLLDGIEFPSNSPVDLEAWRYAIREDPRFIEVEGYSHVFISAQEDGIELSDRLPIDGLSQAYQEVYGRPQVRKLVLEYFRGQDPTPIREEVARAQTLARAIGIGKGGEPEAYPADHAPASNPPPTRPEQSELPFVDSSSLSPEPPTDPPSMVVTWPYPRIASVLAELPRAESDEEQERAWLREIEQKVRMALSQMNMKTQLQESFPTPNTAVLKFKGTDRFTVEAVMKRRSQLLTTYGVNVISIQPQPGAIMLSIARPVRQIMRLAEMWADWQPPIAAGNSELVLGVREQDGKLLYLEPGTRHAPHTLIAGSTGSGKTMLLLHLILALVATNTAEQAELILIDPKQGVDYYALSELPHLRGRGVIVTTEAAIEQFERVVQLMDDRFALLREAQVSHWQAYNSKCTESQRLPALWILHDEFADWMKLDTYRQTIIDKVTRLGARARAAGIFLIFATQRPDANVMPLQLRTHFLNRLVLHVDSEGTSEIALGERGAERLLDRGHFMAKLGGYPILYAQAPYIDEETVSKIVGAIVHG